MGEAEQRGGERRKLGLKISDGRTSDYRTLDCNISDDYSISGVDTCADVFNRFTYL